jgi:hypothetical protein
MVTIIKSLRQKWVDEYKQYKQEGGKFLHNGLIKASAASEILAEIEGTTSETYNQIIEDLVSREQLGIKKYGTTVDDANLTDKQWMQHAYEEALDFSVYLKRLMRQYEGANNTPHSND